MLDFAKLHIVRKDDGDDMNTFTCGNDDLDDFVKFDAQHYAKERLAITYILKYETDIVGYFSLANDRLSHDDFSDSTTFNRFRKRRFVNSKRIKGYPAVKLCRFLTVDANVHALEFYMKNGFNLVNALTATSAYTTPLYFDLADLERMR